jgi:hypothetical protein
MESMHRFRSQNLEGLQNYRPLRVDGCCGRCKRSPQELSSLEPCVRVVHGPRTGRRRACSIDIDRLSSVRRLDSTCWLMYNESVVEVTRESR